jgi:uroporphyrinogen-III synthase
MPHVLLIRSVEDALSTALTLKSKGIESSHYPLFTPRFLPLPVLENPQALIVTSKNGVRSLEKLGIFKHLPLYTVGDKTAELAAQHGFSTIFNASGTSADLLQLILKTAHPEKGVLWHLSGREIKGNIVESLTAEGFEAKRHIVYEMEDAPELPSALCTDLREQKFSHVLLCSPRTTQVFVELLKNQHLEKVTHQMTALCLSPEIAAKASSLDWKNIWVSPRPDLESLLGYFE